MGFYTGVSKKLEDADFYSIKRGDPYLQRSLQKRETAGTAKALSILYETSSG